MAGVVRELPRLGGVIAVEGTPAWQLVFPEVPHEASQRWLRLLAACDVSPGEAGAPEPVTEKLQIEARRVGPTTAVLAVSGSVGSATAPTLLAEGTGLIDAGHRNLVLDLTGVASCDAAAAGVFLDLHQLARNLSGQVVLAGIRGPLQRKLEHAAVIGALRTTLNTRDALTMLGVTGTG